MKPFVDYAGYGENMAFVVLHIEKDWFLLQKGKSC